MTKALVIALCGAAFIAAAILLAAFPSGAQTPQQLNWCNGGDGATPELMINGCTAVIASGKFNGTQLAIAFNKRADAYFRKANLDAAIADYSQAVRFNPKQVTAIYNRGYAYDKKHDYESAIADFSAAIQIKPNDPEPWHGRCGSYIQSGQLQRALSDCNEALKLLGNLPAAGTFAYRGFCYLKLGQFNLALADFDAALKFDPNFADALYGRGIAKQRNDDRAGGDADISAAKTIRSDIVEELASFGLN